MEESGDFERIFLFFLTLMFIVGVAFGLLTYPAFHRPASWKVWLFCLGPILLPVVVPFLAMMVRDIMMSDSDREKEREDAKARLEKHGAKRRARSHSLEDDMARIMGRLPTAAQHQVAFVTSIIMTGLIMIYGSMAYLGGALVWRIVNFVRYP